MVRSTVVENAHLRRLSCLMIPAVLVCCEVGPTEPEYEGRAARVASSGPPELRDGFEGEKAAAFWMPGDYGSGRYAEGAVVISDAFSRSGRRSAKITVREGDVEQVTESGKRNERAELDSGKHALLGSDAWCGFSLLVPPGFPVADVRLVLSQWKQSGLEGSPIVAQRFQAGRHYLTIRDLGTSGSWRETCSLPDLVPGTWHDFVFHVRFATDSSGLVEVWMNGARVVHVDGPTASNQGAPHLYHKVGLYRDRMHESMTVFVDNYALAGDFAAADPSRFVE